VPRRSIATAPRFFSSTAAGTILSITESYPAGVIVFSPSATTEKRIAES
jgi:hypothetical protein